MSIRYHLDRKGDLLSILWEGRVTGEEWLAHIRQVTAEPDWPAVTRILADLRGVADIASIHEADITQAVALFRAAPGNLAGKKAAVPAADAFRQATAFQKAIAHFGPRVIVFNTLETACVYLGLDLAEAQGVLAGLRG
jgi:hypothetical protein